MPAALGMVDSQDSSFWIYPMLTRGAIEAFSCCDVMRFFSKRLYSNCTDDISSDYREREEGVRIKYHINSNSIKAYDKATNLRIESTLNATGDFRAYRASERDPNGPKKWLAMGKGIVDLNRRAEVCQAANERFMTALASLDTDVTVRELVEPVCRPKTVDGRRVRALRPWTDPDRSILAAINDGAFCINGFRHSDIVQRLYPKGITDDREKRRVQGRISRFIRLLRDHGLVAKVPKTYRYTVTEKGRRIITAILRYQAVTLKKLAEKAA